MVRNRWPGLAAALAAAMTGILVALGTPMPASAVPGTLQAGALQVGNLLSYDNSDFEGPANFIPVTNIGTISDSSVASLHGSDSLKFTAVAQGTTVLKLQEGSSPTQINVHTGGKAVTYTLGGWFKLPAGNGGESVTFGLGLNDGNGHWIGWSNSAALSLSATINWQYVEGQVTVPANAAWALDSPQITLSNAAAGQVTYLDMLAWKPFRGAQAIGAHGKVPDGQTSYLAQDWIDANNTIGPLQSDKEFFNENNNPPDGDLPPNWSDTNCSTIEKTLGMPSATDPTPNWPVCIIAYKGITMDQAAMDSFLSGVPEQQELYIVWHNEPEGDTFTPDPTNCPGDAGAALFV